MNQPHARRVVIVGGGGHAGCLLDVLSADATVAIAGYVALQEGPLSRLGVRYLGDDRVAERLRAEGVDHAVLGAAGARDNETRRRLFAEWRTAGFTFVDAIHTTAVVSPLAQSGSGLQCFALSVINPAAVLGVNVIVNTGAIVEHGCAIGDHVHIAPGVTLCGDVTIGDLALIGAGSTVLPGVRIGAGAVVGAGSVVTGDVAAGARVVARSARGIAESSPAPPGETV